MRTPSLLLQVQNAPPCVWVGAHVRASAKAPQRAARAMSRLLRCFCVIAARFAGRGARISRPAPCAPPPNVDSPRVQGIIYMGIMVICVTLLVIPIYFPMWGGMFCGPKEGVVEEDYYLGEFSEEERAAGLADAAMKFAQESKSQRGAKERAKFGSAGAADAKEELKAVEL